ncbi:MAG: sppA [Solimicrobium sp.]|nr:sppA [Solimicrobium sp.]
MFILRSVRRGFTFLWRLLDETRRIFINLLFFALLLFLFIGFFGGTKKMEDKTVLMLDLRGNVVEQSTIGTSQLLMREVQGEKKHAIQLRDLISVLNAAAKDSKISSMVLLLDEMDNAGLSTLREIASGLDNFKANNKKIIAWGSRFNQKQYFLASRADEIYMHPMGMVVLEGFGGYKNYYRDALDKLGITVNLMRVGTFKSFAEPFTANGPSTPALEAEAFLYGDLWATYIKDVEGARKLNAGSIMHMINELPNDIKNVKGDLAILALNNKLVDGLKTRDELHQFILQQGAVKDERLKSFRQINYEDYLARQIPAKSLVDGRIGVIIAQGEISEGFAPPGSIGGLSTAELIRKARENDQIKALVLRINSPGGSAFASELIRRELELTRQEGKPVVVSMGDVAASGGYWISMSADEVFADAATVTGSIGVFALLPTADKAMEKMGIHTGGTTTTWLRGGYDPTRPIDPRFAKLIQHGVNHIYVDFINKAAVARKTTPQYIDEVAQGRVWTGRQAKDRGLIDTLGSYADAVKSAAKRAKLPDDVEVEYIETEPKGLERFFKIFESSLNDVLVGQFGLNIFPGGLPPAAAQEAVDDMRWLADMTDRKQMFGAVTHCMCSVP